MANRFVVKVEMWPDEDESRAEILTKVLVPINTTTPPIIQNNYEPGGGYARADALFTTKEILLIKGWARGLNMYEIAEEWGNHYNTVRYHAASVFGKLRLEFEGRGNEALAVYIAMKRGLIE